MGHANAAKSVLGVFRNILETTDREISKGCRQTVKGISFSIGHS